MKKIFLSSILFVGLVSCGNNSNKNTSTGKTEEKMDPDAQKGLELVGKSDCFTCHKLDVQFTGPAYIDVAAKYPNNDAVIDSLSDKVIRGGAGNWGQVPMTPHPQISKDDAKLMVKYVLSLKNTTIK